MKTDSKAVVVFSGGQDSMTCLALARSLHTEVHALSFDYGQRHDIELRCANEICRQWDIPHTTVPLSFLSTVVKSALMRKHICDVVHSKHERLKTLPASFVPARNALVLTVSHAYAAEIEADKVYTGVCQTDYSGYPDCRDTFINALGYALNVGYEADIHIVTPLMYKTKAQTFQMAADLGVLAEVLELSHTCYIGDHHTRHAWGYGCGECPACMLRQRGYDDYLAGNV